MKNGTSRLLIIGVVLAVAAAAGFLVSCQVADDSLRNRVPTSPGEGVDDFDPPPITGETPSITPSSLSVTIPESYDGGDKFYFYASGGKPPFYWYNTTPMFGTLTALDTEGDGVYRTLRYTLRAFHGTGNDTIYLRDASGKTATATVTIALVPTAALEIIPNSVTLNDAVDGTTAYFSANGGVAPYFWSNTRKDNALIVPSGGDAVQATYQITVPFDGTDTVILRDSTGAKVTATVTVKPAAGP